MSMAKIAKQTNFTVNRYSLYAFRGVNCVALCQSLNQSCRSCCCWFCSSCCMQFKLRRALYFILFTTLKIIAICCKFSYTKFGAAQNIAHVCLTYIFWQFAICCGEKALSKLNATFSHTHLHINRLGQVKCILECSNQLVSWLKPHYACAVKAQKYHYCLINKKLELKTIKDTKWKIDKLTNTEPLRN